MSEFNSVDYSAIEDFFKTMLKLHYSSFKVSNVTISPIEENRFRVNAILTTPKEVRHVSFAVSMNKLVDTLIYKL